MKQCECVCVCVCVCVCLNATKCVQHSPRYSGDGVRSHSELLKTGGEGSTVVSDDKQLNNVICARQLFFNSFTCFNIFLLLYPIFVSYGSCILNVILIC